MSDATFRSTVETPATETVPQPVKSSVGSESKIEVPYLDYHKSHGKPYSVEYFGLGDSWNEDLGGFSHEINAIESYFANNIKTGKVANDVKAVLNRLKEVEKVSGASKEDRVVMKIGKVASYLRFLNDVDSKEREVMFNASSK